MGTGYFYKRVMFLGKVACPLLFLSVGGIGCGPLRGVIPEGLKQGLTVQTLLDEPYHLRVGDELEVSAWGETEMIRRVQIREDGTFLLPPVGVVKAQGRTLAEVENEIQEHLSRSVAQEAEAEEKKEPALARRVISIEEASREVYRLQEGDELDISIWEHDDLNRKVQVREEGFFIFPLVGMVRAAGRTLPEVEEELRQLLDQDFLVNPQVTVRLVSARFSVLGEVTNPGWYTTEGATDLLTAISQAGGMTKSASGRAEVIRRKEKEKLTIPADLSQILEGKQSSVAIFPHDTIHVHGHPLQGLQVTVRLHGAKFSVLGEVERPGTYQLEGMVDILTAISQAGGVTKFGSHHVEIIRGEGREKVTIRVHLDRILRGKDPNLTIQPHDTIYVRRRLF